MADLFDEDDFSPTPPPNPIRQAPTKESDLFDGSMPSPSAPVRDADAGLLSDEAKERVKTAAAEATQKVKAGAGKLADQAGELALKAKSIWVPSVKTKVSQLHVTRKTWALGAGVVLVAAISAYAWHAHRTAPEPQPATGPASSTTLAKAITPGVESSTPAVAPVPKLPGWNLQAGLQVLSEAAGPKEAFTCTLSFNPNIGGGWAHAATPIPGFIDVPDAQHAVIQASSAEVAQQALAAADFALEAKCLTAEELKAQAQATKPVAPVEAPKPTPLPVFLPSKAPAPVPSPAVVSVAKPVAAASASTPFSVGNAPVVKAKPQAKPDNFEKDADAKLDAFFKQH